MKVWFSAVHLRPFCLWNKNAMAVDNLHPYLTYHILKFVFQRKKKNHHLWLNFILGTKWICLKCNIFIVSFKVMLSRATGVKSLQLYFTWNKRSQGTCLSHREAGLLGTLQGHLFYMYVTALRQNQALCYSSQVLV